MIQKVYSVQVIDTDGNEQMMEFSAIWHKASEDDDQPLTLRLRSEADPIELAIDLTEDEFDELVAYVREVIEEEKKRDGKLGTL